MDYATQLTVEFYSPDEASVEILSYAPSDAQYLNMMALVAYFTMRQLGNLRGAGAPLARLLVGQVEHGGIAALPGPRIVPFRGAGGKCFVADLTLREDGPPTLLLRMKGFGLLGRDVGWYAARSVLLLFGYLADLLEDEADLVRCAYVCGTAFLNGHTSARQQQDVVVAIMSKVVQSR